MVKKGTKLKELNFLATRIIIIPNGNVTFGDDCQRFGSETYIWPIEMIMEGPRAAGFHRR